MSYGLTGGGSKNIARFLAPPPRTNITRAAPGVLAARAGLIRGIPPRLWGSIPVEQVEGHEPDRAYDVARTSPFTSWRPLRSERLSRGGGGLGFVIPNPSNFVIEGSVPTGGTQPGAVNPSDPPRLASMFEGLGGSSLLPLLAVGAVLLVVAMRR